MPLICLRESESVCACVHGVYVCVMQPMQYMCASIASCKDLCKWLQQLYRVDELLSLHQSHELNHLLMYVVAAEGEADVMTGKLRLTLQAAALIDWTSFVPTSNLTLKKTSDKTRKSSSAPTIQSTIMTLAQSERLSMCQREQSRCYMMIAGCPGRALSWYVSFIVASRGNSLVFLEKKIIYCS